VEGPTVESSGSGSMWLSFMMVERWLGI
jgi:hypothetical protein